MYLKGQSQWPLEHHGQCTKCCRAVGREEEEGEIKVWKTSYHFQEGIFAHLIFPFIWKAPPLFNRYNMKCIQQSMGKFVFTGITTPQNQWTFEASNPRINFKILGAHGVRQIQRWMLQQKLLIIVFHLFSIFDHICKIRKFIFWQGSARRTRHRFINFFSMLVARISFQWEHPKV